MLMLISMALELWPGDNTPCLYIGNYTTLRGVEGVYLEGKIPHIFFF